MMKDIDEQFMKESRRFYDEIKQSQTVTGCNLGAMIEIYKEYWDPNLRLDLSNATDIMEFIKLLFTRYDEYKIDNKKILQPGQKFLGQLL